MPPVYDPTVFNVGSMQDAEEINLTPENGMDSAKRWEVETPDVYQRILDATPGARSYLDWGCGIGRLIFPLVNSAGKVVVGVEFSPDMRRLANLRLGGRAEIVPPDMVPDVLRDRGAPFDAGIAVWALQHIPQLEDSCAALFNAIRPGGVLCVLNRVERAIPVLGGWIDDGKSVPDALHAAGFRLQTREELGGEIYAAGSLWMVFARP